MGVTPENMLVLEDSQTGSLAASAAGAYTIAIPTKHSVGMSFDHVNQMAARLDDEIVMGLFA